MALIVIDQTPEQILEPQEGLALINRLNELKRLGIEFEEVQSLETRILYNLGKNLPRRSIVFGEQVVGWEYLAHLHYDKTKPQVGATFEILGIGPQFSKLFRYDAIVRNTNYVENHSKR